MSGATATAIMIKNEFARNGQNSVSQGKEGRKKTKKRPRRERKQCVWRTVQRMKDEKKDGYTNIPDREVEGRKGRPS